MMRRLRAALTAYWCPPADDGDLEIPGPRQVCLLPADNPLDAGGAEVRAEAALSLMDPDTYGFLLVRVQQSDRETLGQVIVSGYIDPYSWPAVQATLERTAAVGAERVR